MRTNAVERDLDDELRDYLDRATEEHRMAGLDDISAMRAAKVEVGSAAAIKDEVRAGLWEWSVIGFWRDVRYGLRMIRRTPLFSGVVILTLALGLGATTTLVSVAYAVLLRPLPVTDPQALALFQWSAPRRALPPISIAGWESIRSPVTERALPSRTGRSRDFRHRREH